MVEAQPTAVPARRVIHAEKLTRPNSATMVWPARPGRCQSTPRAFHTSSSRSRHPPSELSGPSTVCEPLHANRRGMAMSCAVFSGKNFSMPSRPFQLSWADPLA